MTKYEKCIQDLQKGKAELESAKNRLEEAKSSLNCFEQDLSGLFEDMKKQVVAGRPCDGITAQMQALGLRQTEATALIAGLEERMSVLKEKLVSGEVVRKELLGKLADAWLQKEIDCFDSVVRQVNASGRRLLACYNILRDEDLPDVYRAALGEASPFLPHMKVSEIRTFTYTGHVSNNRNLSFTNATRQAVLAELIGK
jgi:hypothetical protein